MIKISSVHKLLQVPYTHAWLKRFYSIGREPQKLWSLSIGEVEFNIVRKIPNSSEENVAQLLEVVKNNKYPIERNFPYKSRIANFRNDDETNKDDNASNGTSSDSDNENKKETKSRATTVNIESVKDTRVEKKSVRPSYCNQSNRDDGKDSMVKVNSLETYKEDEETETKNTNTDKNDMNKNLEILSKDNSIVDKLQPSLNSEFKEFKWNEDVVYIKMSPNTETVCKSEYLENSVSNCLNAEVLCKKEDTIMNKNEPLSLQKEETSLGTFSLDNNPVSILNISKVYDPDNGQNRREYVIVNLRDYMSDCEPPCRSNLLSCNTTHLSKRAVETSASSRHRENIVVSDLHDSTESSKPTADENTDCKRDNVISCNKYTNEGNFYNEKTNIDEKEPYKNSLTTFNSFNSNFSKNEEETEKALCVVEKVIESKYDSKESSKISNQTTNCKSDNQISSSGSTDEGKLFELNYNEDCEIDEIKSSKNGPTIFSNVNKKEENTDKPLCSIDHFTGSKYDSMENSKTSNQTRNCISDKPISSSGSTEEGNIFELNYNDDCEIYEIEKESSKSSLMTFNNFNSNFRKNEEETEKPLCLIENVMESKYDSMESCKISNETTNCKIDNAISPKGSTEEGNLFELNYNENCEIDEKEKESSKNILMNFNNSNYNFNKNIEETEKRLYPIDNVIGSKYDAMNGSITSNQTANCKSDKPISSSGSKDEENIFELNYNEGCEIDEKGKESPKNILTNFNNFDSKFSKNKRESVEPLSPREHVSSSIYYSLGSSKTSNQTVKCKSDNNLVSSRFTDEGKLLNYNEEGSKFDENELSKNGLISFSKFDLKFNKSKSEIEKPSSLQEHIVSVGAVETNKIANQNTNCKSDDIKSCSGFKDVKKLLGLKYNDVTSKESSESGILSFNKSCLAENMISTINSSIKNSEINQTANCKSDNTKSSSDFKDEKKVFGFKYNGNDTKSDDAKSVYSKSEESDNENDFANTENCIESDQESSEYNIKIVNYMYNEHEDKCDSRKYNNNQTVRQMYTEVELDKDFRKSNEHDVRQLWPEPKATPNIQDSRWATDCNVKDISNTDYDRDEMGAGTRQYCKSVEMELLEQIGNEFSEKKNEDRYWADLFKIKKYKS